MILESKETKLIICEPNNIYRPKIRKLCKLNKIQKKQKIHNFYENFELNLQPKKFAKSQNLDLVSFEEIEKDFKKLKSRSDILKVEKEILHILEKSTKRSSHDGSIRERRPQNTACQISEFI